MLVFLKPVAIGPSFRSSNKIVVTGRTRCALSNEHLFSAIRCSDALRKGQSRCQFEISPNAYQFSIMFCNKYTQISIQKFCFLQIKVLNIFFILSFWFRIYLFSFRLWEKNTFPVILIHPSSCYSSICLSIKRKGKKLIE